jgi:hypothetical protein
MQAAQFPGVIRFGIFEADLRSGELRRNGLKVRLPEQSFQILVMLLIRPGEVVSREEIRQELQCRHPNTARGSERFGRGSALRRDFGAPRYRFKVRVDEEVGPTSGPATEPALFDTAMILLTTKWSKRYWIGLTATWGRSKKL